MGKKSKDDAPNPSGIQNRDIIQRLNFLYQSSVYLSSIAPPPEPGSSNRHTAGDLSRTYIDTMKIVGRKTTVKIDPSVKRTLCQGCNTVLVPGRTAAIRVKKSPAHRHTMIYTCNHCYLSRRIPAPPTPESIPQDAMNLDASPVQLESAPKPVRRRKRKNIARSPPTFASTTSGHVLFVGNEQRHLDGGHGVYIA